MIWPDTTLTPTPQSDGGDVAAVWIIGRHPRLADLIDRLALADPRLVYLDEDRRPWVELDILADMISTGASAVRVLSGGEQTMLATFATLAYRSVPFTATEWHRMDEIGQAFLRDWFAAALEM